MTRVFGRTALRFHEAFTPPSKAKCDVVFVMVDPMLRWQA